MIWPTVNGPAVVRVLTTETSAEAPVRPPFPVLSVLLPGFGSGSVAETVALLSNEPGAVMVALTLMVVLPPEAMLAMVQGSATQAPLTLVMLRLVGVSVTLTF